MPRDDGNSGRRCDDNERELSVRTGQKGMFTVPLLAAFLIPLAIVLTLVFFGLNVFVRTSGGHSPISGSGGWRPDFGSYWGGEKSSSPASFPASAMPIYPFWHLRHNVSSPRPGGLGSIRRR